MFVVQELSRNGPSGRGTFDIPGRLRANSEGDQGWLLADTARTPSTAAPTMFSFLLYVYGILVSVELVLGILFGRRDSERQDACSSKASYKQDIWSIELENRGIRQENERTSHQRVSDISRHGIRRTTNDQSND